jgi:hypothetical protein
VAASANLSEHFLGQLRKRSEPVSPLASGRHARRKRPVFGFECALEVLRQVR